MSQGIEVHFVGNVTRDPKLRFTPSGQAVLELGIAVNRSWKNKQTNEWEEETTFMDVTCWAQMAENVAESVTKGARVMVSGRLDQRSYEKDGETKTKYSVTADEVGASFRWATATVVKNERREGTRGSGAGGHRPPASQPDLPYDPDEEPF